jgi:hypothetical protein
MILGLSVATFTLLHVIISLIGIATGLVVLYSMIANRISAWTSAFLVTTVLTSATGFLFHSNAIGPPHIVGALSLLILAFTLLAFYTFRLAGRWRAVYVITAILALYLNVFVGVVQAFQKIPVLHRLAPLGNEPPFAVAQALVLAVFAALGWLALRRFHPSTVLAPGQPQPV